MKNLIAKDLRTPKYRKRVVRDKRKELLEEVLDSEVDTEVYEISVGYGQTFTQEIYNKLQRRPKNEEAT